MPWLWVGLCWQHGRLRAARAREKGTRWAQQAAMAVSGLRGALSCGCRADAGRSLMNVSIDCARRWGARRREERERSGGGEELPKISRGSRKKAESRRGAVKDGAFFSLVFVVCIHRKMATRRGVNVSAREGVGARRRMCCARARTAQPPPQNAATRKDLVSS